MDGGQTTEHDGCVAAGQPAASAVRTSAQTFADLIRAAEGLIGETKRLGEDEKALALLGVNVVGGTLCAVFRCADALERIALALEKQGGSGGGAS